MNVLFNLNMYKYMYCHHYYDQYKVAAFVMREYYTSSYEMRPHIVNLETVYKINKEKIVVWKKYIYNDI